MCIDRPDHIARGKVPAPVGDWERYQVICVVDGWADAFRHVADGDMEISWGDGTPEEKAAAAECHVRDWANYYGHAWIDGKLVVFGEP